MVSVLVCVHCAVCELEPNILIYNFKPVDQNFQSLWFMSRKNIAYIQQDNTTVLGITGTVVFF